MPFIDDEGRIVGTIDVVDALALDVGPVTVEGTTTALPDRNR